MKGVWWWGGARICPGTKPQPSTTAPVVLTRCSAVRVAPSPAGTDAVPGAVLTRCCFRRVASYP
eukprot:2478062-Rhodomonas_salina.1